MRSTPLRLGAAAALALLALAGCGDDSGPAPGRGTDRRRGTGPTTMAPAPTPTDPTADERFGVRPLNLPPGEAPTPEPATPEAPEATPEPARDLEAELRGLAGDASGCFEGGLGELPEVVRIDLTASVSTHGVVTRASASGSGVPAAARACLGQRIEGGRFRAPVPDAPRTIRAQVVLQRQPRPVDPSAPRPP